MIRDAGDTSILSSIPLKIIFSNATSSTRLPQDRNWQRQFFQFYTKFEAISLLKRGVPDLIFSVTCGSPSVCHNEEGMYASHIPVWLLILYSVMSGWPNPMGSMLFISPQQNEGNSDSLAFLLGGSTIKVLSRFQNITAGCVLHLDCTGDIVHGEVFINNLLLFFTLPDSTVGQFYAPCAFKGGTCTIEICSVYRFIPLHASVLPELGLAKVQQYAAVLKSPNEDVDSCILVGSISSEFFCMATRCARTLLQTQCIGNLYNLIQRDTILPLWTIYSLYLLQSFVFQGNEIQMSPILNFTCLCSEPIVDIYSAGTIGLDGICVTPSVNASVKDVEGFSVAVAVAVNFYTNPSTNFITADITAVADSLLCLTEPNTAVASLELQMSEVFSKDGGFMPYVRRISGCPSEPSMVCIWFLDLGIFQATLASIHIVLQGDLSTTVIQRSIVENFLSSLMLSTITEAGTQVPSVISCNLNPLASCILVGCIICFDPGIFKWHKSKGAANLLPVVCFLLKNIASYGFIQASIFFKSWPHYNSENCSSREANRASVVLYFNGITMVFLYPSASHNYGDCSHSQACTTLLWTLRAPDGHAVIMTVTYMTVICSTVTTTIAIIMMSVTRYISPAVCISFSEQVLVLEHSAIGCLHAVARLLSNFFLYILLLCGHVGPFTQLATGSIQVVSTRGFLSFFSILSMLLFVPS